MKTGKISTRVLAFVLCAMMVIGVVPMTAFAAAETEGTFPNSQLSLVQDKQSTLASGVTQDIYTVYDKNGKQDVRCNCRHVGRYGQTVHLL